MPDEAPAMIVLDDLHWADRPSLLLLKALLQAALAVPLVIVGTYRDTDLDRTHPLSSLLGDLRREPGVERLALAGLDAQAVADLVDALAGQDVAAVGGRSRPRAARGDRRQSLVPRRGPPLFRGVRRVGPCTTASGGAGRLG